MDRLDCADIDDILFGIPVAMATNKCASGSQWQRDVIARWAWPAHVIGCHLQQ